MARGGARTGAGRKRHVPPLKKRCVTMTDAQAALLRKWGRGDMSAGLRWLIDSASSLVLKTDELQVLVANHESALQQQPST